MEAAFFDLDKTVIAKASMVAFGRPLLAAGMISRRIMVRALWSHLVFELFGADEERMKKFRESALRVTAGWDQARVSALVRDNLVEVIEPIVYDEALELIRRHQAAGRRVFLVSASPEEIVAPLAQFLGVDEAIASRARLDESGRYTGEVEFYSYGPFKAEAIVEMAARDGIDLDGSYAYSDSATDVPMLEVVGHPIAVNPDRDLARIAKERNWEVRTFAREVALRDRVSMPRPRRLVIAGSVGVGVAGVGAATWWWWRRRSRPLAARRRWPIAGALASPVVRSSPWASRRAEAGHFVRTRAPRMARLLRHQAAPVKRWAIRRRPAASSRRKQRGRARR